MLLAQFGPDAVEDHIGREELNGLVVTVDILAAPHGLYGTRDLNDFFHSSHLRENDV